VAVGGGNRRPAQGEHSIDKKRWAMDRYRTASVGAERIRVTGARICRETSYLFEAEVWKLQKKG